MWRALIFPIGSLITLALFFPFSTPRPARVIGTSRLPATHTRQQGRPLISQLLGRRLLRQLSDPAADEARVRVSERPSALSHLNRSSTPVLSLCMAPQCGACDMIVLTLLHRKMHVGPAHDPLRGVVEQWTRPAEHFTGPSARLPPAAAIAAAAASGDVGAVLAEVAEQLRVALHPQLLSDPHDWQLQWRQQLPGPVDHLTRSSDGRLAAPRAPVVSSRPCLSNRAMLPGSFGGGEKLRNAIFELGPSWAL